MRLFATQQRSRSRYRNYAEGSLEFLSGSPRPQEAWQRRVFEAIFEQYPETVQSERNQKSQLRGRFCSKDNGQHTGACLELYLHRLLSAVGATVAPEPVMAGRTERPDFYAQWPSGSSLFLEAVTGLPERAWPAQLDMLMDKMNEKIESSLFFVCLRIDGRVPNTFALSPVVKKIGEWIHECERAELKEGCFIFSLSETCQLEMTLIPKSSPCFGQRLIGSPPSIAAWGGTEQNILTTLSSKIHKYGHLDAPYVIAFNSMSWRYSIEDLRVALLGSLGARNGWSPMSSPEGLFFNGVEPQARRVSAVLAFHHVAAHTLRHAEAVLIHNPWAEFPLYQKLIPVQQQAFDLQCQDWVEVAGQSAAELLHLESLVPGEHVPDLWS